MFELTVCNLLIEYWMHWCLRDQLRWLKVFCKVSPF